MNDGPLYQDEQLKVDYLSNSDDHFLEIGKSNEQRRYVIQRGILEDLARSPRGDIEGKINTFNDLILYDLEREGVAIDGLHVALCQAFTEEQDRVRKFMSRD